MKFISMVFIPLLMLGACVPQTAKLEVPSGQWQVLGESGHFQLLGLQEYQGSDNGLSPAQVQIALDKLEALYTLAGPVWKSAPEQKIRYYKFASREDRKRLAGVEGNGEAFVASGIVHSIFLTDPHETAHVLTAPKQVPHLVPFWTEGIAMYYTLPRLTNTPIYQAGIGAWHGKTVHYWAQKYLQESRLPALTPLVAGWKNFRDLPEEVGYPVAGSFLTFLLGFDPTSTQKLRAFKEFLSQAVNTSSSDEVLLAFKNRFGLELTQAEAQWRTFLEAWDEREVH